MRHPVSIASWPQLVLILNRFSQFIGRLSARNWQRRFESDRPAVNARPRAGIARQRSEWTMVDKAFLVGVDDLQEMCKELKNYSLSVSGASVTITRHDGGNRLNDAARRENCRAVARAAPGSSDPKSSEAPFCPILSQDAQPAAALSRR